MTPVARFFVADVCVARPCGAERPRREGSRPVSQRVVEVGQYPTIRKYPLRELQPCERNGGELGVADLDALRIPVGVVVGLDGESGDGGRRRVVA